ncbi:hypothetical protein EXIGLDRAFT_846835 [Exidia glandulosa HHB12029]|uniref:Uncharacterized protein n=1 Tax=Exidia glandulosa HHB12029 TaxID=1314781 RepID=A0A166NGK1_EXIGL|nr:hypothetical protein EXIGLDRAFT_846835 [Exidia glandulosa HHB12029]
MQGAEERDTYFWSRYSEKIGPYLPTIGRVLIVASLVDDALSLYLQWDDQIWYLERHRKMHHVRAFLIFTTTSSLTGSAAIVCNICPAVFVTLLAAVLVGVSAAYGLGLGAFRNTGTICGLVLVLLHNATQSALSERQRRAIAYASGGILVFLAAMDLVTARPTLAHIIVACLTVALSIFILLGVKPTLAAAILVSILVVYTLIFDNWAMVDARHPSRPFLRLGKAG